MTPQEQGMLGDLVRRIQSTQLTDKDPEAQQFLDQQLGGHPDSLYVLAQTVLVQKYALEQAQKQIEQLKQQAATQTAVQPAQKTSFLGNIFGHSDPKPAPPAQQSYPAPPPYTPVNAPPAYPQQSYAPAYAPAPGYAPPGGYAAAPGGGSSFLRSAATTAAGVAAGALAFEGVESLMHGFGHEAGFGGGYGGGFGGGEFGGAGMGGFGGGRPEETVINNYYDEPGRGGDRGDRSDDRFDASDRDSGDRDAGDRGRLDDASYNTSSDDLQPEIGQADDVQVGDDGSDAYVDDSGGGDFGGGGDDSSFV